MTSIQFFLEINSYWVNYHQISFPFTIVPPFFLPLEKIPVSHKLLNSRLPVLSFNHALVPSSERTNSLWYSTLNQNLLFSFVFCVSTEFIKRSSMTYWSSEGKQNLSTNGMEEVRWCGDVADKPVDVMKLLHHKVIPKFLQGNKHTKL